MREKDYFKRSWLNPNSHGNIASISAKVTEWDASLTIVDCSRQVTIHSGGLGDSRKERADFLKKLNVMKNMINDLYDEVIRRWP